MVYRTFTFIYQTSFKQTMPYVTILRVGEYIKVQNKEEGVT